MDRLTPLLHIDPVLYLPPEITFDIFSHLDPETLLRASALSKSWRARALDTQLWRNLFGSEGWNPNIRNVKKFEEEQRKRVLRNIQRKSRTRPSEAVSDVESKSPKKRVREGQGLGQGAGDERSSSSHARRAYSPQWAAQHDDVEADEDDDYQMVDVSSELEGTNRPKTPSSPPTPTPDSEALDPPIQTELLLKSHKEASVNWQYLFKQKRRLEANWKEARFTNFQLPHPKHPEEAHAECVYTIQYSGSHLVSGSRDKTLRIWDLDTQRLAVKPLCGHDASVLCLQFDDRPEQDIVISGGSDCHVILWRFSTGEMILKMERAHNESVLNLRFDDRFLITCSKDKTIKVWNRTALLPTDDAYPHRGSSQFAKFPSYILNVDNLMESELHRIKPLKEYSLLMMLEGHNAAVNAIQILDSQIVSASGDRTVKIWDVKTGQCLRTLTGHNKGIACVQFDGRRIVSGSSDETVRIFDRITGAEVACLMGHQNLVRTVQARFGDVPGSQAAEEAEARAVDRKFLTAKLSGALPSEGLTREQRHARNAGGKDPKDIFAVGAKLPPGGGGSKWARIVSGSYDETVIIWRRGDDGKWVPKHRFHQWQAVMNAGGRPRVVPPPAHHAVAHGAHHHAPHIGPQNGPQNVPGQAAQHTIPVGNPSNPPNLLPGQPPATPTNATAPPQAQASNVQGQQQQQQAQQAGGVPPLAGMTQAQLLQHLNHQVALATQHQQQAGPSTAQSATATQSTTTNTTTTTTTTSSTPSALPNQPGQQQQGVNPSTPLSAILLPNGQTIGQAIQAFPPQLQQQFLQTLVPPGHPLHNTTHQPPPPHHPPHGGHVHVPHPNNPNPGTNSRVFKLQFDSRRIICCSQDPTIVGWDFANGDEDIEKASLFFGEDY